MSEGIASSRLSGHICKQLENLVIRFELQTRLIILRQQSKWQKGPRDLQLLMMRGLADKLIKSTIIDERGLADKLIRSTVIDERGIAD